MVVEDDLIAWHVGYLNGNHLGVELVQQTIDREFSDWQYEELERLLRYWCRQYGLTYNSMTIYGHDESSQGISFGKTDPGYMFDWSRVGL